MSLNEAFSTLKYDKRMKDWNIEQGFVTEKNVQEHLKTLKDVSDNVEPITLLQDSQESVEQTPDQPREDSLKQDLQKTDPVSTPLPGPPDQQPAHHTSDPTTIKKDEATNKEANDNPWW